MPGVFLCLHLIEGQIVQPLTVGRRFEVNALVVLLAVWFGYGFWGIPGMLLAMPVVVALKVAAQYQPNWRTVRDFLSPNGLLASAGPCNACASPTRTWPERRRSRPRNAVRLTRLDS